MQKKISLLPPLYSQSFNQEQYQSHYQEFCSLLAQSNQLNAKNLKSILNNIVQQTGFNQKEVLVMWQEALDFYKNGFVLYIDSVSACTKCRVFYKIYGQNAKLLKLMQSEYIVDIGKTAGSYKLQANNILPQQNLMCEIMVEYTENQKLCNLYTYLSLIDLQQMRIDAGQYLLPCFKQSVQPYILEKTFMVQQEHEPFIVQNASQHFIKCSLFEPQFEFYDRQALAKSKNAYKIPQYHLYLQKIIRNDFQNRQKIIQQSSGNSSENSKTGTPKHNLNLEYLNGKLKRIKSLQISLNIGQQLQQIDAVQSNQNSRQAVNRERNLWDLDVANQIHTKKY